MTDVQTDTRGELILRKVFVLVQHKSSVVMLQSDRTDHKWEFIRRRRTGNGPPAKVARECLRYLLGRSYPADRFLTIADDINLVDYRASVQSIVLTDAEAREFPLPTIHFLGRVDFIELATLGHRSDLGKREPQLIRALENPPKRGAA